MQAESGVMPPVPKPPTAKSNRNRNIVIIVVIAAVIGAALIGGSLLFTSGGDDNATATTSTTTTGGTSTPAAVSLVAGIPQHGTLLGNPVAKVRMAQYEDLQCPVCKRYTDDALPAIIAEYVEPGNVQLDFRGLAFLGQGYDPNDSEKALRIALAAGKQNKLWEVVGLFYANQGSENSGWVTDELVDSILAQVPGLDAAKVKVDAQSAEVTKQIAAVQAEATARAVPGTPTFFITAGGGKPYRVEVQSLTPESFRPILDDALNG